MGDIKGGIELFKDVPGLLKKKNNQIEAYVARRAERMKKFPPTQEYCRLLTLELMFLWHTLPTMTAQELKPFLDGIFNFIQIQDSYTLTHCVACTLV